VEIERPEWLDGMAAVLETLNEGVLIRDDCNHILFVNQRFTEMTGFSAEEMAGHSPGEFYSGEDQDFLFQQMKHGETAGSNRFEFYLPEKKGGRLPVMISARQLEDPEGRLFAIITATDISEQKRTEEQLRNANAELEARHREIEMELALAARVQQSLAPQGLVWGSVAVETFYLPVRTIGGDFGLVSPAGTKFLNLMVCDVSGHGISSALMANRIYSETMSHLERGTELGEMLRELNRFVLQNLHTSGFYFSAAVARLDGAGRKMSFAGAGHPPSMIVQRNGSIRLLESRSMILGAFDGAVGQDAAEEIDLERGDRIVLYTDALNEAFDRHGEMLGIEGLEQIVRLTARLPLDEMKVSILQKIETWRHGPPADDTSLVLAEVL
jgi:PAS domain S-box-containing protein